MKNKIGGYNLSVTIDICDEGGHAVFKNVRGEELEIMMSRESIAYIACILDRAIDHSCIINGDDKTFFDLPDDKTN